MSSILSGRSARDPDAMAVADDVKALTWAELEPVVNLWTRALMRDISGDTRCAVVAENSVETVVAYLSCLYAGVSALPVNYHLRADEIAILLDRGAASLILCSPGQVAKCLEATAGRSELGVIVWGAAPDGARTTNEWCSELSSSPPEVDDIPARPNLMLTSGTTGRPKGVERPFELPATVGEYIASIEPLEGPRLVAGPLYHSGPQQAPPLVGAGTPLVVQNSFDAEGVLATIERHGVTNALFVPTHFARLLALPAEVRSRYDLSTLTDVAHTAAPCPEDLKRSMIDWWGPVIWEAYGSTETGILCAITAEEWLERPGSVGRTTERYEVVVLDDLGDEVAPGVEGRLCFRDRTGRGVRFAPGMADSDQAAMSSGDLVSAGEIGYVDETGYVYITDRASDMVVSGGVNLYPAETEAVLLKHPDLSDVAVIGVPSARMGEEMKALVVRTDPTLTDEQVIAWCRQRLSSLKCPVSVDFVESLNRTALGKLDKAWLRKPYWDQLHDSAPSVVDHARRGGHLMDVRPHPDAPTSTA